jgi:rhamnosyltransferase
MFEKICSITVTFNPHNKLINQIKSLKKQVESIIIVDNGTKNNSILNYLRKKYRIKIILNNENVGLAQALNIGIKFAIKKGYKWILTMDQDSIPDNDMVNKMTDSYNKTVSFAKQNIAGIFPFHIEEKYYNKKSIKKINKNKYIVNFGITSGSLLKTQVFKKIGFFKEEFFIDYIDYEFCMRAGVNGYKFLQVNSAILLHSLGDTKEITFFNKKISFSNHSPLRRYYITRNRFYTYRYYWKYFPGFVKRDLQNFIKEFIKIILFEKQKIEKIFMIILGFFHFIINKSGNLK